MGKTICLYFPIVHFIIFLSVRFHYTSTKMGLKCIYKLLLWHARWTRVYSVPAFDIEINPCISISIYIYLFMHYIHN